MQKDNAELYSKIKEVQANERLVNAFNYKEYFTSVYGSLLPLEEIDEQIEDLILKNYFTYNNFHIKFLILNLQKTRDSFKYGLRNKLGYLYIRDLSDNDRIEYINGPFAECLRKEPREADFLYNMDLSFSTDAQDILMTNHSYVFEIIKNPTIKTILSGCIKIHKIDIYAHLRMINYPITEELHKMIRLVKNRWHEDNKTWDQMTISFLINEFEVSNDESLNKEIKMMTSDFNDIFISERYVNRTTCILQILKQDTISNFNLHRLANTPIGRKYLMNYITENQNYKKVAQLLLDEIKDAQNE